VLVGGTGVFARVGGEMGLGRRVRVGGKGVVVDRVVEVAEGCGINVAVGVGSAVSVGTN
jgi:hypothetical protein